jgi:hypothetical protein
MYYVYFTGETYLCARGPEFKDPFGELEDVKIYDYDDVKKWPDSALTFEARRVEAGKNYDPYAMVAIDWEKNRRDEKLSPPWFDDMDDMLDDFDQAEEDDDYEDDWDVDDGEEPLELMARLFSEHIQNADADDQFVAELGEATDQFLTEKGFDLSNLAGLKKAQAWLENAKVEDAFYSEGPIENAIDWHVGEARIAAMLKVVKARIEKSMKK